MRELDVPCAGRSCGRGSPPSYVFALSVGADVPIGPNRRRVQEAAPYKKPPPLWGSQGPGAPCAPLQKGDALLARPLIRPFGPPSPQGEGTARRVVAPHKKPPPLWGSQGPGAHIGAPLRRRAGSFFVIARRAAGPTRQSVSPRTRRIPSAPLGPRNDGSAGASPRPTWFTPSVGAGVPTGPRAATWDRPFVVASSIAFASACGESSLIPLLRLSPPNPRLSPLGFGGGPKNSYLLSPISTLHSQLSSIFFKYCPV